jgi:hypothetical protein
MIRTCQQCHAEVAATVKLEACPACAGKLVPNPGIQRDDRQPDHRGILLPARHAVGGVITPR